MTNRILCQPNGVGQSVEDINRQADQIKALRLELVAELNSPPRLVVGEFQCDGCAA